MRYELDFSAPNKYTQSLNGVTTITDGTYTVCNGYIKLTHDVTGTDKTDTTWLPYEMKDGEFTFQTENTGFDITAY